MAISPAQQKFQDDLRKRGSAIGNFFTAPFKNIPNAISTIGSGFNALRQSRGDEMRASQNRVVQPSQSSITRSKLMGTSPLTTLGPQRPGSLPMSGGRPLSNTMGPVPRPPSTAPKVTGTPSATSPAPQRSAFVDRVSTTPSQSSGFQSTLATNDPAAIGGQMMNRTLGTQVPPTQSQPMAPLASQPRQEAPQLPGAEAAYKDAYTQYIQSLAPGKDSQAARQKYLDFIQQRDLGLQEIADKRIPLRFVTGQQESVQKLAGIEGARLQGDIELAQGAEAQQQQQARAALDFQQEQLRREDARRVAEAEGQKPIEVGGRLVNPRTGEVVYEPPAEASEAKTFTLSPGQRVYGADGQLIAQNDGTTDKFTNVSPGSTVIDSQGNVIYRAPKEGEGTDAKAIQAQVGELDTTIGLVDEIVNNPAFKQVFGLSGVTDPRNYLPGSPAQYLKSQIEQLKAFLALENRQKLKGQGTISDREFKVLTDAATALNAKLGDQDALRELTKLRDALTGRRSELSAGGSGDLSSDPDFQALRNDPDLKNYSDAQIRDILGKTEVGSDTNKLQSVKIGSKNVVVRKEIAPRLEAAAKEFKATTGKDLLINQDYRSSEHQAELYRKSQAGEIGRAAPPGYSRHEHGLAIDVTNWKEAEKILRKYGFKNDLADDRNHFSVGEFV